MRHGGVRQPRTGPRLWPNGCTVLEPWSFEYCIIELGAMLPDKALLTPAVKAGTDGSRWELG